ncbi:hypothetical protein BC829DRAFT_446029 [Chytridium lagenaria]|nr:hypothetical protein BC829DRAFT_446029 [Chytridium lagenaria]
MSQPSSTTGRKLPSGVGSGEEDVLEELIKVGGSGSEAVQAVGEDLGNKTGQKRWETAADSPGIAGFGIVGPGLVWFSGRASRPTGSAAPSSGQDPGVGDWGVRGGGEGSLTAGSRGVPQRMCGAGSTAEGGTAAGGAISAASGAGVIGDANGVTRSVGDGRCEALVGGTEGVRAFAENPDASQRGSGGAQLPRMVLPLTTVMPARIKVLGILAPAELPFTESHLLGGVFAALTVYLPNQPLRSFLLHGLARVFALLAVIPEERHVVVSNHASATAFHLTAADQLRANSAQEVALGWRLSLFTTAEAQQFPVSQTQQDGAPDGTYKRLDVTGLPGAMSLGSGGRSSSNGCVPAIPAPGGQPAIPRCVSKGMVFVDHALMFGWDAGLHCCQFGNCMFWILWVKGGVNCVGYSDNVFGAAPAGIEDRTIAQIRGVFGLVGYNLKLEVLFGTAIRVLGLLVETRARTISLELSRRNEICKLLLEAAGFKVMTAQRVSVVAGTLTRVCQVLQQGQVYLSNVYGLLGGMDPLRQVVVLVAVHGVVCRYDVGVGGVHSRASVALGISCGVVSDSSLAGAGLCTQNHFWLWKLATVALGLATVGGALSGQCIQWHTDNANKVAVFEKGYGSTLILSILVREVVRAAIRFSFELQMVHLSCVNVEGCDRLSQGDVAGFIELYPGKRHRGGAAGIARCGGWGHYIVLFATDLPRSQSYAAVVRRVGVLEMELGLAGTAGGRVPAVAPGDWAGIRNHESVRQALAKVRSFAPPPAPNQQAVFTLDHLALLRADLVVSSRAGGGPGKVLRRRHVTAQSSPGQDFEEYAWLARTKMATAFTQYLLFSVGLPGLDGTGALQVLLGSCPPMRGITHCDVGIRAVADTAGVEFSEGHDAFLVSGVGSQLFNDLGRWTSEACYRYLRTRHEFTMSLYRRNAGGRPPSTPIA